MDTIDLINISDDPETNVDWFADGEFANEETLNRPIKEVAGFVNQLIENNNNFETNVANSSSVSQNTIDIAQNTSDIDTLNNKLASCVEINIPYTSLKNLEPNVYTETINPILRLSIDTPLPFKRFLKIEGILVQLKTENECSIKAQLRAKSSFVGIKTANYISLETSSTPSGLRTFSDEMLSGFVVIPAGVTGTIDYHFEVYVESDIGATGEVILAETFGATATVYVESENISQATIDIDPTQVILNGGLEINLFEEAGSPSVADTYTFFLNGGDYGSTDNTIASIRAGSFPVGSQIVIICRSGADWQGKGGDGATSPIDTIDPDGGICYLAEGINTDIYLSGADPVGGNADGYLRAPGGGGGYTESNDVPVISTPGGGGAGINIGIGGSGAEDGTTTGSGGSGAEDGTNYGGDGGDWGQAGTDGVGDIGSGGGLAGKGIVKGGAIVNIYGQTAERFINGIGDTPDN